MKVRWQIGLGLGVAGALVAALQLFVTAADREDAKQAATLPTIQPDPKATPNRDPASDPASDRSSDRAAGRRELLQSLHGEADVFHLAQSTVDLPDGVQPVVAVAAGGAIRIAVPPPMVETPGSHRWPDVGVLLPKDELAALTPAERSSLLEIWARLRGSRQMRAERVRIHGIASRAGELERLLCWMR